MREKAPHRFKAGQPATESGVLSRGSGLKDPAQEHGVGLSGTGIQSLTVRARYSGLIQSIAELLSGYNLPVKDNPGLDYKIDLNSSHR